jgi:hypothetical protein
VIRFVAALIDNETTGAVPFVTFCANRLPNPSYVQLNPHCGPVVAADDIPGPHTRLSRSGELAQGAYSVSIEDAK